MFQPRRGKIAINPGGSPEFQVQYIGNTETFVANGTGCTTSLVQKLWDNSPEERFLKHASLIINSTGIELKFIDNRRMTDHKYDIKDISYCCAQQEIHERVFAWICKSNKTAKSLECHAVLCSSKEKAQTISLVLSRAFHIAYREWKLEKEKKERTTKQSKTLQKDGLKITPVNPNAVINGSTSNGVFSNIDSTNCNNDNFDSKFVNMENGSLSKSVKSKEIEGKVSEMSTLQNGATNDHKLGIAMAQMNIVEEDEISFTDNTIAIEAECDQETYSEYL